MPGLDPGAVVGVRRVAGDPSLPGRVVDLRHRMEVHAELPDPLRLVRITVLSLTTGGTET
jgi:hypothetical protein